jgi:hypothetical protein
MYGLGAGYGWSYVCAYLYYNTILHMEPLRGPVLNPVEWGNLYTESKMKNPPLLSNSLR